MAQAVNVNLRMDAELKKNMEQVCEDMEIRFIPRLIWHTCVSELQHLRLGKAWSMNLSGRMANEENPV